MSNVVDIILRAKDATATAFASAKQKLSKFASSNAQAFKRAAGVVKGFAVAIGAMGAAAATAVGVVVKAYAAQQQAENDLAAAIRSNGGEVDTLMPKYKALAAAIQDETGAADESTLALMAKIRNLGIADDKMEDATKGALGLAKALGIDQATAARYAALALNGEYTTLQRYIPALRTAKDDGEKMAIVQDMMAKGYEQQKEGLGTLSGRYTELKGRIGDFLEQLGGAISNSSQMEDIMASLSERIKEAGESFAAWVDDGGMNRLMLSVKMFAAESIKGFMDVGTSAEAVFTSLYDVGAAPFKYLGNVIGAFANAAAEQFRYMLQTAQAVGKKIANPFSKYRGPSSAMRDASRGAFASALGDTSAFTKISDNFSDMNQTLTEREQKHAEILRRFQQDYEAAESKRLEAQAERESQLDEDLLGTKKDVEMSNDVEIAAKEAELDAKNIEAKKQKELNLVREVAQAKAAIDQEYAGQARAENGVYISGPKMDVAQMATTMAQAYAEATSAAMRDVITETNAPLLEELKGINANTKKTADSIMDAVTISD